MVGDDKFGFIRIGRGTAEFSDMLLGDSKGRSLRRERYSCTGEAMLIILLYLRSGDVGSSMSKSIQLSPACLLGWVAMASFGKFGCSILSILSILSIFSILSEVTEVAAVVTDASRILIDGGIKAPDDSLLAVSESLLLSGCAS